MIYDRIRSMIQDWLDWRIEAVRFRNEVLGSALPRPGSARRLPPAPRPRPRTDPITQ